MRTSTAIAVALGSLVFAASGCGSDDSPGRAGTTPNTGASVPKRSTRPASTASNARTTTIKIRRTRYGRILVDGRGRALYLFTREGGSKARCYGACADAWPVLYARGRVRAATGADDKLVGTTRRRDGGKQATYAGHPLYYYVTDRKPGQVTCQNVTEYGGTWLVVGPSGAAIR
jgi:predicted lipoprotein with Yx(FWY)xxD motif